MPHISLASRPGKQAQSGLFRRCFVVFVLMLAVCTKTSLQWNFGTGHSAGTLPPGFIQIQQAAGLQSPTAMAIAPDGRIFICQQGGQLRVVKNGALLPVPALSLSVASAGERGLLGIAFDPAFQTNQYIYLYYTTATVPIHNRVSRFTLAGDLAVAGSETILLDLDNLTSATNHNGGAMHFGADGTLYIAVGDNVTSTNAQSLANLHGKMLRINSDGSIPAENPFYNHTTGSNRAIWALGLRNPFTFAIQPGTARMFINDVGQAIAEEINDGIAGSNYGWPACEGPCNPANPTYRDPLFSYLQSNGGCAITGGVFYNPAVNSFPALYNGKYFYVDYCAAWIRFLDPVAGTSTTFATLDGGEFIVDLDVSNEGSLYYLQRGIGSNTGQLWRIDYLQNQPPQILQHPSNASVSAGQPATFTVQAVGEAPLSYQWQRNGVDILGATSANYTISSPTQADHEARFRCQVTNEFGNASSNEATLLIIDNQPPTASILTPAAGTTYRAGQTISFSGSATDPETGSLPASAFTWEVVFHHDDHTHPAMAPTSGIKQGSFTIPRTGETAINVWYRIRLTVTDPAGLSTTTIRDVFPQLSTLTLQTNPPGLQLLLDGAPVSTPHSFQSVVGVTRSFSAPSLQQTGESYYAFSSWSNGKAQSHTVNTPVGNTTYTATFVAPVCNPSISPVSRTISTASTTGTITLTTQDGCPWTAQSNVPWITINGNNSGVKSASISYTVAVNAGVQRTGTLTIAGKTFTLTQQAGCSFVLAPTSRSFPKAGGTGSFSISTDASCPWTAVSGVSWITVNTGASGIGPDTVTYTVKSTTVSSRTGRINVNGVRHTVTQGATN